MNRAFGKWLAHGEGHARQMRRSKARRTQETYRVDHGQLASRLVLQGLPGRVLEGRPSQGGTLATTAYVALPPSGANALCWAWLALRALRWFREGLLALLPPPDHGGLGFGLATRVGTGWPAPTEDWDRSHGAVSTVILPSYVSRIWKSGMCRLRNALGPTSRAKADGASPHGGSGRLSQCRASKGRHAANLRTKRD